MNTTGPVPLVLVIDDSATVRKIIEVTLRREGAQVVSYGDPLEALRALFAPNAAIPVLAFVERNFPRSRIKSGLTVLEMITSKASLKGMAIVMVGREDRVLDRLFARLAGAEEYLVKPLLQQAILATYRKFAQPQ